MRSAQFIAALLLATPLDAQAPQPPVWSLTRDAKIGSDDGSDGELLSPAAVTVGPNGHIFVFDYTPSQIKEYDRTGRFVGAIGRKGQGPGEFKNVHTLGFLGDTLWASDVDHERITLFAPGYRNPKTYPASYAPNRPGLLRGTASAMLRSGLAVAQGDLFLPRSMTQSNFPSPIVLLRRDGTIADTIAAPMIRRAREISVVLQRHPDGRPHGVGVHQQPFQADPIWRGLPDGIGIVLVEAPLVTAPGPSTFTIQTFDASGRRGAARSYSYQPIAITDRLRDSVVRAQAGRAGAEGERAFREQLVSPRYFPPVTDLLVGRDGAIWVQREKTTGEAATWNVIDASGAMIGRVTIPGIRPWVVYADQTQVLIIERDADGIPWVVRYRVGRDGR